MIALVVRKWWFWLACLTVLALLIGVGLWINWLTETAVTVDVSGSVRHLHTRAQTVGEVLDEANILIDPEDSVEPDPAARLKDGMTIHVSKAAVVVLESAGQSLPVRTVQTNPLVILAEQQITIGPYDVLRLDGQDWSPDEIETASWDHAPTQIIVLPSAAIQVIDGERTLNAHTIQPDIARALDELGLELYLGDGISPAPSEPIVDGLIIQINRAVPITLIADGKQIQTRSHGPTVVDALAAVGVAPLGEDYTLPPLDTPLTANMTIQVVRVTEQIISEQISIPYSTRYRLNPALAPGAEQVIRPGVAGEAERVSQVRLEDGVETSRTIIEERVFHDPEPALIEYGPSSKGP